MTFRNHLTTMVYLTAMSALLGLSSTAAPTVRAQYDRTQDPAEIGEPASPDSTYVYPDMVRTADSSGVTKTSFKPGDPIQLHAVVRNKYSTSKTVSVVFKILGGPSPQTVLSGSRTFAPGYTYSYVATSIAAGASAGSRTFSVTVDGSEKTSVYAIVVTPPPPACSEATVSAKGLAFVSVLGAAVTLPTRDGTDGVFQLYEHGEVSCTAGTGGPHELHGLIYAKRRSLDWNTLGYPLTDETSTSNASGAFGKVNQFQNGSVYYKWGGTEAFELHGAIHAKYRGLGGEKSCLGYPTSDERNWFVGGMLLGRMNKLEKGELDWRSATGATTYKCF